MNSMKIVGFLVALLVPTGCVAVEKNFFIRLFLCCCGTSAPEKDGPTEYEQGNQDAQVTDKNTLEYQVDALTAKTEELLQKQDQEYVEIGQILDEKLKGSNERVKAYLKKQKNKK